MEPTKQLKCAKCSRELDLGADVLGFQEGVIGTRGFVPLADMELYCSDSCAYGEDPKSDAIQRPRRVP